jgi:hypothetical protein
LFSDLFAALLVPQVDLRNKTVPLAGLWRKFEKTDARYVLEPAYGIGETVFDTPAIKVALKFIARYHSL